MPSDVEEHFELTVDDAPEQFLRAIEQGKARTANIVTILLVAGVIAAPIVYVFSLGFTNGETRAGLDAFFEKWFGLIGPLVGTAIGFYFGVSRRTKM